MTDACIEQTPKIVINPMLLFTMSDFASGLIMWVVSEVVSKVLAGHHSLSAIAPSQFNDPAAKIVVGAQ
jgi:hypothetical protein